MSKERIQIAPEFFDMLCAGDTLSMTPTRLRQMVEIIHDKLSGSGYRAAA